MSRSRPGSGIARNFVSHSRSTREDWAVKPRSGVGSGAADGRTASAPRAKIEERSVRMTQSWCTHPRGARPGWLCSGLGIATFSRHALSTEGWVNVKCFGCAALLEAGDADALTDAFVAHAREVHAWSYPEQALRNYARNYGEATERVSGDT